MCLIAKEAVMEVISNRINIPRLLLGWLFHEVILLGITYLFCWVFGIYTIRKVTDATLIFGFCYALFGLETWVGRAWRFYHLSDHFRGKIHVTKSDRPDLVVSQRAWILLVYENRFLIPWALAGVITLIVAFTLGLVLPTYFSMDTVLGFLVRKNLPFNMQPGFWK
jgi:hypothetical protein